MVFPTPVFDPNALLLEEDITYITPQNHPVSATFEVYKKRPHITEPILINFSEFSIEAGDYVTFTRPRSGKGSIVVRKKTTGQFFFAEFADEGCDKYYLWTSESFGFNNRINPIGTDGIRYWGKISGSEPIGYSTGSSQNISTISNRVNERKVPVAADSFLQTTDSLRPIFTGITASSIPVTASRFTTDTFGNSYFTGGTASQYVSNNGYHVISLFHVSSMSNGAADNLSSSYALFTDTNYNFGAYFRTSSQSGFSPDDQYVDIVMVHTSNSGTTKQSITASMNELHKFEASYDYGTEKLTVKIDDTASEIVNNLGPLINLGDMKLGTNFVPIGSGSTTVVTSSVTSSVDVVEISFATTESNTNCITAVDNYFDTFYNRKVPIAYKTPKWIANANYWGRMSPGDFVVSGNFVTSMSNKSTLLDPPGAFQVSAGGNGYTINIVDAIKPLSGANLSSSNAVEFSYQTHQFGHLVSTIEYQIFAVVRTNEVNTNGTSGTDLTNNEAILTGGERWGLHLRQGSGSTDAVVYGLHRAVDDSFSSPTTISSSITLGQIYLVDWSYVSGADGSEFRIQINDQTPVIQTGVQELDLNLFSSTFPMIGQGTSGPETDTDLLELVIGSEAVTEPERSLLKKYFFDRYSITASI